MKSLVCLFIAVLVSSVNGANTPTLKLDFEKYTPAGTKITGGEVLKIQSKTALVYDKKRKSSYLAFNGRNETLEISPATETDKSFENSFTLEFDFFSSKLPFDANFHNPGSMNIQIFSAIDSTGKEVLGFYGNRYNRFSVNRVNRQGKTSGIQSTWNHRNNYELTGMLRDKWYHVALVYNQTASTLDLYLDGEKMGSTATSGTLQTIKQLRFGGNLKGNPKAMFNGGIDNLKLTAAILYNEKSEKTAESANWQRLHLAANKELSEFIQPEDPKWAEHHPRMLLTPAGIEIMKYNLQKGRGPELLKRLILRCDNAMDPSSPDHLTAMITGHDINFVMRPAELCLATILTGDKKYAEYAAKIVTKYTDTVGYYDVAYQLVESAGLAKPIMAVTLAYDWGYDYFTPEQRQSIRLFLLNVSKATYDFYNNRILSKARSDALNGWAANWTALSIATLGNASLAITGETLAPVTLWLNYAKFRAAQYGLFAIGADGCFFEMPGYLAFGAGPIIVFMEALYTAGGDNLIMETNFSKFPNFLPYITYPYSRKMMPLKYSRTMIGLHSGDTYIMALLRKKVKTTQMEWDWQKIYENTTWAQDWSLFSLIWFEPQKEKISSPNLPLAKWFKSEGVVAFHSDWTKNAVAGIFMAYPAKMKTHDQCDRGQFTLYGYQGRWIIDNGGRQEPQYAWRDAHNLITVDGNIPMQKARLEQNYHHDAFITGFCTDDSIMTATEADLTQSYRYTYTWGRKKRGTFNKYGDPFKNAKRKLLFMREKNAPPYLLVYDTIQQDNNIHTYTLSLHTDSKNEVTINGSQAKFHQYPVKPEQVSYLSHPENQDGSKRYYYSGNPDAGYAEYNINVPVAGKYDLYGFGRQGNRIPGGMDSFFIKFGGRRISWGNSAPPEYKWSKINEEPFDLEKGKELLTVLLREPEARVAKFALYPDDAGIPLFNKPDNPELIMIDAGKPDKLVKDFIIGTEKVNIKTVEADMTLLQLSKQTDFTNEVFKGVVLPHQRLQSSIKAVKGEFLDLFYPHSPNMEQPTLTKESSSISRIQWKNCRDFIYTKNGDIINSDGLESDADLVLVRKKGTEIVSFVMINGSYIKLKGEDIILLAGGKGIAGWAGKNLAVSGINVSNFTFKFPPSKESDSHISKSRSLKLVTANGNSIKTVTVKSKTSAARPFAGQHILKW